MTLDRPFVTLNVAVTADGKADTAARRGAAISSPQDLARVDRLRAASDAISVGGRTLLGDDPRLTVKSADLRAERRARGLTENPIKVGIASNAELRLNSRFLTAGPAPVILFTTEQTDPTQIARLAQVGADVYVFGEARVDLPAALRRPQEIGVQRLLVEGGGTLNAELLRLGLVDEVFIYIAPLIFGGATAPTLADGPGLPRTAAIRLELCSVEALDGGGILICYRIPMRVHSECLTGDAIGSLRCDCRDQLESALQQLGQMDKGILLYLRQEGRGHWPDQQDPRLWPAGSWLRHRRGQPGVGLS